MKKQTIPNGTYLKEEVVNTTGNFKRVEQIKAQIDHLIHAGKDINDVNGTDTSQRENLIQALKRVERNKGSHGVDGMPVQNLRPHIVTEWYNMKTALLQGTYQPQPVRRVEIPKPNGGVRLLGIPTVTRPFHSTSHRPNIDQDI